MSAGRTVLLTGFEPFANSPTNASWEVVHAVAASWDDDAEGAHLVTALLPVSFAAVVDPLNRAIERWQPILVLSLGLADGRERIGVERVALNLADARIADNDGDQPVDQPIEPDGPAARFATIPIKAVLAACRERDLPVEESLTAGTFVCNATMFHSIGRASDDQVGFIHVPQLDVAAARPGTSTLPLDVVVESVLTIIRTCLAHHGPDLRIAGGQLS